MRPHRLFLFLRVVLAFLLFLGLFAFTMPSQAQNGISVILHYIEGKPSSGKLSYDVQAFVSVYDASGTPVKGLKASDFTLTEDSKGIKVGSVASAESEPISLVLAIDTSGSMYTQGIDAARQAAWNFVSGLAPQDQVAIISFNDTISRELEPTTDHKAATDRLALINAIPDAGTCLYDAAFIASQIAATYPAGRRAVILLTDGKDEVLTPLGNTCSTHTIDDVIAQASNGNTRVPIYTIGVREKSDEKSLERMAQMTGGNYHYTPSLSQIGALFSRLSDQLKSEYVLTYELTSGPGAHALIVQANTQNGNNQDTRNFILPALPTSLSIVAPVSGQEVKGKINIVASVTSGQGEPISQVVLQVNGTNAGTKSSTPYEFEWDFSAAQPGPQVITMIAQDAAGKELAKAETTINVVLAAPTSENGNQSALVENATPPAPEATSTPIVESSGQIQPALIGGIAGGIILLAVIIFFVVIPRKKAKKAPVPEFKPREDVFGGDEPATIDNLDISALPEMRIEKPSCLLGRLIVEASDDPDIVGQKYNIDHLPLRFGRSSDCEIVISKKDQAVSRFHALLTLDGNRIFIIEITSTESDGSIKRPTYHTFVNNEKIGTEPVVLKDGDRIRLGSRMTMCFESLMSDPQEEMPTMDSLEFASDIMQDAFAASPDPVNK